MSLRKLSVATSTRKQSRRRKGNPKPTDSSAGKASASSAAKTPAETSEDSGEAPASEQSQSPANAEPAKYGGKFLQIPLIILSTLAVIHAVYFARAILFPIALSIVLFFLLAPLVRLLTRFRLIPESLAAAIVVGGVACGIALASYAVSGPMARWFTSAPETLRKAEVKLRFVIEPVDKIDEATEKVSDMAEGSDEDTVKVSIKQPPVTNYILSATMTFLAGGTITIVLVYLLLAMGHRTLNSVVELIPTMEDKRGFVATLRDVEQGISRYLLTITAINICLGILIGTSLGLLGMPDPLLLGIMAAALNFIPYAGCFLGCVITFLIGVVYLDSPAQAVMAPLIYLTINAIEGNVITPMVLGRSMKLNPVIVFTFIIFWGWVWGVGGVLIAVPLLGIIKIACDHTQTLKPVARILTG